MILALVLLAYLLGSIPFGKILGLYKGVDIQKEGSGNIGFANAVRVLGWRMGALVLAGDILKGYLAMYIAAAFLEQPYLLLISSAAVLGHVFPIWLNFKGGKAIATGFGAIIVLAPVCAALGAATYITFFIITRNSGKSSLAAAFSMPLWAAIFAPVLIGYFLLLALFATYTHRTNIKLLIAERAR